MRVVCTNNILLRIYFTIILLYNMSFVIYDSNTTFTSTLDIDNLSAPAVDALDIDATRTRWFNLSELAIKGITVAGRAESGSVVNQKIKNVKATITKGSSSVYVDNGNGGVVAVPHVVTVQITSILTQTGTFATYANGVLSEDGLSVTKTAEANIYKREVTTHRDTGNDTESNASIGSAVGNNQPYDVALGCYTWECIYQTDHPFTTTTESNDSVNANNASVFGNLIYDSASLNDYRQDGYTQIIKTVCDNIKDNTILYAIPKTNADGSVIDVDAAGLHELDWYLTPGDVTTAGKKPDANLDVTNDTEVRAKFWYDILIDYAEHTSEIEVDRRNIASLTAKQVHPYISVGTVIDPSNNTIESTALRLGMLQKNLETMIVNIMNKDALRKWNKMTRDETTFAYTVGDSDLAEGTMYTNHANELNTEDRDDPSDIKLKFNSGVLEEAVIPIEPTGTTGSQTKVFRANLNLKFTLGTDNTVLFTGQEEKTIESFMVGITVDPSS